MADEDDIVEFGLAPELLEAPLFGEATDEELEATSVVPEEELEQVGGSSGLRPFGKTWEFNHDTGQFVRHGNRIAVVDERDAFAQWCMNVLHTERFTAVVFSDQIGMELEDLVRSSKGSEVAAASLRERVEAALAVHDRFESISEFTSQVDGSIVSVNMTINTTEGEVEVTTRIEL